jgi:ribosomal protein S26
MKVNLRKIKCPNCGKKASAYYVSKHRQHYCVSCAIFMALVIFDKNRGFKARGHMRIKHLKAKEIESKSSEVVK